jgi:GNAT superfamily N-acetyltransferase
MPRRLSLTDLEPAVEIMLDAFDDDPIWLHLIKDPEKRARLLSKLYRTVLKIIIKDGELYGVGDPLQGIAWWVTPTATRSSLVNKLGYARVVFSSFLPYILPVLSVYDELDEKKRRVASGPHYYLKAVGVSSRSRSRGVGSKLIRPFLIQADKEEVPVYLETITPSTLDVYKHYGFEVAKHSTLRDGITTVWCMLRQPRTNVAARGI